MQVIGATVMSVAIELLCRSCDAGCMKNAEDVTFGGPGPARAAELRAQVALSGPGLDDVIHLFWRHKPLVRNDALVGVTREHPVLSDASDDILLMGCDGDKLIFAAQLSTWDPSQGDVPGTGFLDPTIQVHPAVPDAGFAELRSMMTTLSAYDASIASTARGLFCWHESHRFCANCGVSTQIAMAGWQRDCAACGRHHFPRTDPVVIMLITYGNSVLVGRSPGWPEGMYSLLAGFVEPGETIEAAVRREVFEEAGVTVGPVHYLASQPWTFPASLMLGCAGVATDNTITIDPGEIEDARWVTREEMADVFAGQHPEILPARKGAIAHFLLERWLMDVIP